MYNGMDAQKPGMKTCVCTFRYTPIANTHRYVYSKYSIRQLLEQVLINKVQLITAMY